MWRIDKPDPVDVLLDSFAGVSDPIERQEARGQRSLVRSESLPTDSRCDDALRDAGISLGEPYSNDPMFRPATLPSGWRKEASDHPMWSYIVDERGYRRFAIFYKAAFYDRSASVSLVNPPVHHEAQLLINRYADAYRRGAPLAWPDGLTSEMEPEFVAWARVRIARAQKYRAEDKERPKPVFKAEDFALEDGLERLLQERGYSVVGPTDG